MHKFPLHPPGGSGQEAVEQDEPAAYGSSPIESIHKSEHQVLSGGESDNLLPRGFGGSKPGAAQQAQSLHLGEVREEPVNKSGRVVLSNGESITLSGPYPNGGSLPSTINGLSLATGNDSSMGDLEGHCRKDGPNPPAEAESSICAKSRSADSSDSNFSEFYKEQEKMVDVSGKGHSQEKEIPAAARRNSGNSCQKAKSLSTAQGRVDKPHSLKSKSSSVTFQDGDSYNNHPPKQSLGISKHVSSYGTDKSADTQHRKVAPLTVSTSDFRGFPKGSTHHNETHQPQVEQEAGKDMRSPSQEAGRTHTQQYSVEAVVAALGSNQVLKSKSNAFMYLS